MAENESISISKNEALRRVTLRFLSVGQYEPGIADVKRMDSVTQLVILNLFILTGLAIAIPYTIMLFLDPEINIRVSLTILVFCIILGVSYFLIRIKVSFKPIGVFLVYTYTVLVCYLLILHPAGGPGTALWSMILPPLAYYILGHLGLIPSLIVSLAMIYAFYTDTRFYDYEYASRFTAIFIFLIAFSGVSYKRMQNLSKALMRSRFLLRKELIEVSTMKENIDAGIFILNKDFEIQPYYSHKFSSILNKQNLDNVCFLSLFKSSLKEKEKDLLKAYLEMVIAATHDKETLQNINPLQKFSFFTESGQEKILNFTFSHIKRQTGEDVLLGIARDITYESKLEERVNAEEKLRQQEMNTLFEVMHIKPQNLQEFLDEIDYEFERMNSVLKESSRSGKAIISDLYQGVHAMKSNALVIGLESTAEKLHEFENKLATLMNEEIVPYENIVDIVFNLQEVMSIADNLKTVLAKMETFSKVSQQVQTSREIFLQSIRNAISKGTAETQKKAILEPKEIHWEEIDITQRRILKDAIMQLVRNSLAHGIEPPSERLTKGKNEEGVITLEIIKNEKTSKINMVYADDGAGVDFKKIKEVALEKKLITDADEADNQAVLIKTLFRPGFSTSKNLSMQAGRGIGLSLVSDRINEHKGKIKVKSSPDKGTMFIITLPC